MEWKEFIVEITKALAWPASLILILVFLKEHIADVLLRLTKFKMKDTELEFSKALNNVKEEVEQLAIEGEVIEDELNQEFSRLESLVDIAPKSAATQAFSIVDKYFFELISRGAPQEKRGKQLVYSESFEILRELGIPRLTINQYRELLKIRNLVLKHKMTYLTEDELNDFISLAKHVANSLREKLANK